MALPLTPEWLRTPPIFFPLSHPTLSAAGSEELRNDVFYKLLLPGVVIKVLSLRFCGIFCWLAPLVSWWFGCARVASVLLPSRLTYFEAQLPETRTGYFCGATVSGAHRPASRGVARLPHPNLLPHVCDLLSTACKHLIRTPRANTSREHLVRAQVCYADVAVFDAVRESLAMPQVDRERLFSRFPKLTAFLARMEAHKQLAPYLAHRGFVVDALVQKHAMPSPPGAATGATVAAGGGGVGSDDVEAQTAGAGGGSSGDAGAKARKGAIKGATKGVKGGGGWSVEVGSALT